MINNNLIYSVCLIRPFRCKISHAQKDFDGNHIHATFPRYVPLKCDTFPMHPVQGLYWTIALSHNDRKSNHLIVTYKTLFKKLINKMYRRYTDVFYNHLPHWVVVSVTETSYLFLSKILSSSLYIFKVSRKLKYNKTQIWAETFGITQFCHVPYYDS